MARQTSKPAAPPARTGSGILSSEQADKFRNKSQGRNFQGRRLRPATRLREQAWIVDETRQEETVSSWNGLGDFGEAVFRSYRRDFWQHQQAWLKVFSEKSTVGGIVRPVLNEFAVSFRVLHGFNSATASHDVADESLTDENRDLEILYVGDFDPSGMFMSQVDLPGRLARYGGSATICRIALVREDCTEELPSFSAETKRKDPRYAWFVRNHGNTCWELDAMDPNALRARVREAIIARLDLDAWEHCRKVEIAERESLSSYVKAWRYS
jgi:hypothetical protein